MPLSLKELIKKWELEHESMCVRISEIQDEEDSDLLKAAMLTNEADVLKSCINELKESVYTSKIANKS